MNRAFLDVDEHLLSPARTPRWLQVSGRALFALLLVVALALLLAPWQQSSHGVGQVVAFSPVDRPQEIHAPINGRVARWHVTEGTRVRDGDLLVEMEDIDPAYLQRLEENRRAIEDALEAARERASAYSRQEVAYVEARKLKMKAAELKVDMAGQKIAVVDQEIEAAQAQVVTTEQNLKRRKDLLAQGLVSDRDVELAELDRAKAQASLNAYRAKRTEALAERKALEADLLRVGSEELGKIASSHAEVRKAQSDEAKAREELIKIDVSLSRQRSSTVRASRSGTVLWVNGNLGANVVKAGETLVILVPEEGEHAVELWVDGNDVPLVQVDRKVRLQFEGWPAVQFAGWPQVAVGTFGGTVAFVDAMSRKEGKFRVVVRPDPEEEPWPAGHYLRQGVRTHGWVLLDEVSLGFELWRQLNGFPASVSKPGVEGEPSLAPSGDKAKGGS